VTFEEILNEAVAMLQRQSRVSYRALKRQFDLDDDYLEDLKNEILYTQSLVLEDGERGLIWTGETAPVSEPSHEEHPNVTSASTPYPRAYTPPHLVEKILTSHATLQGERKQVTVLFCDLANSTGLAEQLGPEAMHAVLNQFFALALDAVHRYEGTINQFLGDGFMALFGAPIAHEDHARRAVLAAQELRLQIHAYNTGQDRPQGGDLAIRMGLNTGVVVVGAIGDNLRMDYTAVGDTTNVAARLEQEAAPNQIICPKRPIA
jgi:class 3 adenylate cyclase